MIKDLYKLVELFEEKKIDTQNMVISYILKKDKFDELNNEFSKRFMGVKNNNPDIIDVQVGNVKFVFKKEGEKYETNKKWWQRIF